MNKNRSHFIYKDESGVVGTEGDFVVGLLFVKDRNPIYEIINRIREKHFYYGELHFSQIFPGSSKRARVACEILDLVLRENIFFSVKT